MKSKNLIADGQLEEEKQAIDDKKAAENVEKVQTSDFEEIFESKTHKETFKGHSKSKENSDHKKAKRVKSLHIFGDTENQSEVNGFERVDENEGEGLLRMAFIEAIPLSIGLAMEDGRFQVLIPRNSSIPFAEKQFTYYTVINNQYSAIFDFFEGERKLASENRPLGSLFIEGLTPGKTGTVSVDLWIGIDADGRLYARAEHAGHVVRMALNNNEWMNGMVATDEDALAEVLEKARISVNSDEVELARQEARSELIVAIEKGEFERPNMFNRFAEFRQWYYANAGTASKAKFEAKLAELGQI